MNTLKVVIPPHDVITLKPNDFLASGGEGAVYKKSDMLFKIYHNPPSPDLENKIGLLSKLRHKSVISPISIIRDENQHPVGFNMKYIKGETLVKVFSNDWRATENFTNINAVQVVEKMRDIVKFAHDNKSLIVDGNEMNYIIDSKFEPYIIDVDSWQIDRFKATAIMASIRDLTQNSFTELTDWYSWAVVTFQIFAGIHPYRGRHPDFEIKEFEKRVMKHVSVFNKDTRVPQATRDFSNIPKELREWYVSVFEDGKRSVPPLVSAAPKPNLTIQAKTFRTVQNGPNSKLTFAKVRDFPSNIISVFPCGVVILSDASVYDWAGQHLATLSSLKVEIIAAPITGYIAIQEINGKLLIQEIPATKGRPLATVSFTTNCQKVLRSGERVFAINGTNMTELNFRKHGPLDVSLVLLDKTWQVSDNAQFFKGVGIIDALGASFLILPVGISGCSINRAKELEGHVVLDAIFEGNLVTVKTRQHITGLVNKFEFTLSNDYSSYTTWCGKTDLASALNVVVKGNVAVTILDDEELSVFMTTSSAATIIKDSNISTNMKLCMFKGNVHFYLGDSLWQLSL